MEQKVIGRRINLIRKSKGITSEKLAEMAGVSPVYIRHIECGARTPSLNTFISITSALDTTTDFILRDEENVDQVIVYELERKLRGLPDKKLKMVYDVVEALVSNIQK